MDKAKLIALAKTKGLDIAEDAAQNLVELAVEICGEVIKDTKNKYDDMIWMAVSEKIKDGLTDLVDKIDGEEG